MKSYFKIQPQQNKYRVHCQHFLLDGVLTVMASVPIKKNTAIKFNYVKVCL